MPPACERYGMAVRLYGVWYRYAEVTRLLGHDPGC